MMQKLTLSLLGLWFSSLSWSAPILMSPDWGHGACAAWNQDPVLTHGLFESEWIRNDGGKGFKIVRIYRSDCDRSAKIELRIAMQDNQAYCTYGGVAGSGRLSFDTDYVMHATTPRWLEMGRGEYGPMRAMMLGRLSFDGPMGEAMANMKPFESFLLLVGKVESSTLACPQAP